MLRLRWLTLGLLVLLSLAGFAAAALLVMDPTGAWLRLTVEDLPGWLPVADWLMPRIVVGVLFGVLPAVAAVLVFRRSRSGWTAAMAVGLLTFLWSLGQIAVIGLRHAIVQAALLIVGILLTGLGVDGGARADAEAASDAEVDSDDADESRVDVRS
jgi:hypothetical protein